MRDNTIPAIILGVCLIVGLVGGGHYLQAAARTWQAANHSVTVKGLAERDVPANLALWPLHFSTNSSSLGAAQQKIDAQAQTVRQFLHAAGFVDKEITLTSPQVSDEWANLPASQRGSADDRYKAEATMLVRTPKIQAVKKAMPRVGELIGRGVLLSPNYNYRTEFLFTDLNRIKPRMIAEATANARAAARQFAKDSGSHVGAIRHASQGYFSISDLDSYTPEIKKVRVVTTIDYALDN
ncbi:SIMPL domain-containing protein [Salinisphaera hydrothermalis]|uniref:SIMPL domain-containing protein n=1 Tax=Salinisphaera hydrothermalis TaxID=563188 RepID=UPI00333E21C7